MKIKNMLNYTASEGKKFTMPSLTIPDETMSIRELLSRHANGMPLTNGKEPYYADENSMGINPKTLDLTEWAELKTEKDKTMKQYKKAKAEQDEAEKIAYYKQKASEEALPEGH